MASVVYALAGYLGVHVDLLRIALCITSSFPLASIVKRIPANRLTLKDLVVILFGIIYLNCVFSLHQGTMLLLFCAVLTFTLARVWPNRWFMPWLNFLLQMLLMLATHCREQFSGADYVNEMGISSSQMILLQKLTSYAWNIYDGTRPEEEQSTYQKNTRIVGRQPLLRYLAWIFFFPTIFTGPACTYREYSNWTDLSMFKEVQARESKKHGHSVPLRVPHSGTVEVLKMLEGFVWVFIYLQTSQIATDLEFYKRDWYVKLPFLGRILSISVMSLVFRVKYYAAWLLADAACIHSGLGFNGINPETGRLRWDRMRNVSPMLVETSQNIHGVFANWNIVTAGWLRHYVYLRVTPRGKKPGTAATFATFIVSALWHGTRPGYYLTFVTGAVYQTFGKIFRHNLKPAFDGTPSKRFYDVLTWVITQLALGYASLPFILLNTGPSIAAWKSVYFYIHIGLIATWVLLVGPGRPYVVPKLKLIHRSASKTE